MFKSTSHDVQTILGESSGSLSASLDDSLMRLLELLHDAADTYMILEDRLMAKKMILVQGDLKALSRMDQELMGLAQKTLDYEQKRLLLMEEMGVGQIVLKDFLATLPPLQAKPLWQARQRLLHGMESVAALTKENQDLLQVALKWVASAVDCIAQHMAPEGASYGAKGKKKYAAAPHVPVDNLMSSTVEIKM
jgi:hypothetical protein